MFYSKILTFVCLLTTGCYSLTFSNFDKATICDITERLDKGCSNKLTGVRGLLHCVYLCSRDVSCIGASFDVKSNCFLHGDCQHEAKDCTTPAYMAKDKQDCVHGTWNATSHSCNCFGNFQGARCENYPQSCLDFQTAGYPRGLHAVHIDPKHNGRQPIPVFCELYVGNAFKTLLMRTTGSINFNRSWEEYANGFYVNDQNMWVGLDSIHHLGDAGYTSLLFTLRFKSRASIFRTYVNFVVSSGKLNYTFTFSGSYPFTYNNPPPGISFGDCLGPIKDTPFSTWDRDNDGDGTLNCASRAGSGWWYSGCDNPCNALGYGFEYWNEKPSYQLFSLLGVDMNQLESQIDYFEMYVVKQ